MSECNHQWTTIIGYGGYDVACRICRAKANNDEITTLRQQLEQAQARAAELELFIRDAEENGTVESELAALLSGDHSKAWLLRKQAEAVDELNRQLTKISEESERRLVDTALAFQCAASTAGEEAYRLRQQADEIEKAGGGH